MRAIRIITLVLFLGLASAAFCQPLFDPPFGGPAGGPRRERIRERIKTIKIWKLTEDLNLSEKQSEQFFPVYNKFQIEREEIENRRQEIFMELNNLTLKENPSEEEINSLLDRLDDIDREMNTKRVEFRKKLANILTTRQIGRLYVFEVLFRRQIQEIIRDARMGMKNKMQQRRHR